jgi:hypothetical protein
MAVELPMKTLLLRDEPLPSAHTLGLLLCLYLKANNFETWSLGLAVHHALAFGLPAHLNAILYWAARLEVSVDVRCHAAGISLSNQWTKKPLLLRDLLNKLLC